MTEQPKNNMPEIPAGQDPGTYWWGVVELNKQLQERVRELEESVQSLVDQSVDFSRREDAARAASSQQK